MRVSGCSVEENRPAELIPPEPPVAVSILPERRTARKGAPVLRGVANPCARAPFWPLRGFPTGGAGGRSDHPTGGLGALGFYGRTPACRVRLLQTVSR